MTYRTKHNLAGDHVHTMATGKVLGRTTAGTGAVEEIDISSLGGGSSAPVDATFVTLSTNATLTNERVLSAGSNITITDNGAGSTVVIAATGGVTDHGALTGLTDDDHVRYGLTEDSTAPASPAVGQRFVDIDTGIHYTWSAVASAWVEWH